MGIKRGDTMRTNSIITLLDNPYGKKEDYSQEELDAVKSIDCSGFPS